MGIISGLKGAMQKYSEYKQAYDKRSAEKRSRELQMLKEQKIMLKNKVAIARQQAILEKLKAQKRLEWQKRFGNGGSYGF